MAFTYNPKDAAKTVPPGSYPAELVSVVEKTSKKGNQMLECLFRVPYNGRDYKVYEYIVEPSSIFKLQAIAKALNRLEDFFDGTFDLSKWVGSVMTLKLKIREDKQYGDKNVIEGFSAPDGPAPITPPAPLDDGPPTDGDEIPF